MSNRNCVALFGTCGGSLWRDSVIAKLEAAGVASFNPQIMDRPWTEADGVAEVEHLEQDQFLLMAITDETGAEGSLGETGWLALSAVDRGQEVHFVITDHKEGGPKSNPNRARKLVRQKIASAMKLHPEQIFLHDSIELATEAILTRIAAAA